MPNLAIVLLSLLICRLVGVLGSDAAAAVISPTDFVAADHDLPVAMPAPVPERGPSTDVASMPVPYFPAPDEADADRVLPESLTAPANLVPRGSLRWAGIQEAVTLLISLPEQPGSEAVKQARLRELAAAESPNLELLTAIPAPEPSALALTGFALAAGCLVIQRRRRLT